MLHTSSVLHPYCGGLDLHPHPPLQRIPYNGGDWVNSVAPIATSAISKVGGWWCDGWWWWW